MATEDAVRVPGAILGFPLRLQVLYNAPVSPEQEAAPSPHSATFLSPHCCCTYYDIAAIFKMTSSTSIMAVSHRVNRRTAQRGTDSNRLPTSPKMKGFPVHEKWSL